MAMKVLLAYDGSEGGKKALEWLVAFGKETPVEVRIVNVFHFPNGGWAEYITGGVQQAVESLVVRAEEVLEEAAKAFSAQNVVAKPIFLEGYPATEIIRYLNMEPMDLVVCGSRGLSGFESLMLGSVAHSLVNHSPVPVLVVK